jgi:threonine dehydratase
MINLKDIQKAREQLTGIADMTPCIRSQSLSMSTKGEVYLKLENLQRTGSFKVRGAYNAISQLPKGTKGVIAASAGNHSQGVAFSARHCKVSATIVMPTTAPLIKVTNTRALGAEVIQYGQTFDVSFAHAKMLAKKRKLTLIHAFDDEHVIAGQGTIGLEITEQLGKIDVAIVPIGGGGLISGVAVCLKSLFPKIKVIGVQATGASALYQAYNGKHVTVYPKTIADGIAIKHPGKTTLAYIKRYVDDIVLVDDDALTAAIVRLLEKRKLIAEPAGVAALAAVHAGKIDVKGKKAVCILSGGNIDVRMLSAILRQGMVQEGRIYEFKTQVEDRPGGLHRLLGVLAEHKANILSIQHERLNPHAKVTHVEVDMIVEIFDHAHKERLKKALSAGGYSLED